MKRARREQPEICVPSEDPRHGEHGCTSSQCTVVLGSAVECGGDVEAAVLRCCTVRLEVRLVRLCYGVFVDVGTRIGAVTAPYATFAEVVDRPEVRLPALYSSSVCLQSGLFTFFLCSFLQANLHPRWRSLAVLYGLEMISSIRES